MVSKSEPLPPGVSINHELRTLNDSIHNDYALEEYFFQIVDTPHFQRLRGLKQLGITSYVFPSAAHTRFEHSLGVGHLTRTLVDRLWATQPGAFAGLDFLAVRTSLIIAGLCHDLGHGPFSHLFDGNFMLRAVDAPKGDHWTHEKGSVDMLDDLLRYLGLQEDADGLMWLKSKQNGDIPFSPGLVKAVIDSGKGLRAQADVPASLKRYASPEVRFLFQIVANDDTGIDVDRFDYFRRDTYNAGAQTAYNPMRLVNSARIVEGQIAFPEKEFPNLRLMFQTRFNLFKHVYTHRVSEAINLMVVDALLKADGALRISSMVHNPAMYVHLTDGILDQIAASAAHGWRCMCGDPEPCDKNSESEHFKSMAQARGLVERIRKRDLYQLAFEKVFYNRTLYRDLTRAAKEDGLKNQILEKDSTEKLRRDDFHVDLASIHHGDKENDPMVKVLFFSKDKPDKLLLLPRDTPLPDLDGPFIEYRLRVYARNREHTKDIHAAAKAWLKSLTPGN